MIRCAQCGETGIPGTQIVPMYIKTIVEASIRVRHGSGVNDFHTKRGKKRPVHRWLHSAHTGRDCSAVWHRRYREWMDGGA